jgi:hypothetical protein
MELIQSHEYFLYAGLMFTDMIRFAWIVQSMMNLIITWLTMIMRVMELLLGSVLINTDTDDDEDLVSSKITQKLTMTGKVLCECD